MPSSCRHCSGRRCDVPRRIASFLLSGLVLSIASPPATLAQSKPVERSQIGGPYTAYIADAAQRFGMPELWIAAVLDAESAGDPRAVSSAGAQGLMQVMPDTWAELRVRYRLGDDPFAVRDNIMAGAAYLREMWNLYGNVGAMLAAYNAGPGRYDEYLSAGRPLPAETRAYVAALAPILGGEALPVEVIARPPAPADWREAPLFVTGFDAVPTALLSPSEATDPSPREAVFVPRAGDGVQP